MEYLHDDNFHDSLRAHFQTVDIVRLNEILVEAGLTNEKVRRSILDSYFFDAGEFFDNGWFEADGRRFAPVISFQELSSDFKRTERFYLPGKELGTIFHEFSHGTVAMLFEPEAADSLSVTVGEIGHPPDAEPGVTADGGRDPSSS